MVLEKPSVLLHQSVAILCIDGESPTPEICLGCGQHACCQKRFNLWSCLYHQHLNIETSRILHSTWTKESLQAQVWIHETLKDRVLLLLLLLLLISFKIMLNESVPAVAGWVSNTSISIWVGSSMRSASHSRRPWCCSVSRLWHVVVTWILSVHGIFIRILWQLFAPR